MRKDRASFAGSIADLLEAPPIDLRARGFRRASRARQAWDKRISEDVVWRIWIDGDRYSSVFASVLVPFFAGCRPFASYVTPYTQWSGVLTYDAATPLGRQLIIEPMFDIDKPRRRLRPHIPQTAPEQLAWLIDEHVMPYFERFTTLDSVLEGVVEDNARDKRLGHFPLCKSALLRWRLGDSAGAENDLDLADASIVRRVYHTTPIWPPSDWFRRDPAGIELEEKLADESFAEDKAFVREVRSFVRHHDPTKPVVALPLWPGLADVERTWRGGTWRWRYLKTPWAAPTLLVVIHDEDVVGIVYGPTASGTGEAYLGPGPAYFDDNATYDVDAAAEGLAAWALAATGAQVDIATLRELLAPADTVDLLEALTRFCELLGLGLPKR
jgi:hypothetical protein